MAAYAPKHLDDAADWRSDPRLAEPRNGIPLTPYVWRGGQRSALQVATRLAVEAGLAENPDA